MSATDKVETQVGGFDLDAVRERRAAVSQQWAETVDAAVSSEDGLTGEVLERANRYQAEYDALTQALEAAEVEASRDNLAKAQEHLTSGAPRMREVQAKLDADVMSAILNPKKHWQGEIDLGQPAIVKNEATGRNEVMPFPTVHAEDGYADLEATFRLADIVQADKYGLYKATGERVDGHNAPVGRERVLQAQVQTTGDWTLTTIAGMLVNYLVNLNEMLMFCKVIQSNAINQMQITRRTALDDASQVAESADIGLDDSTYQNVDLPVFKFGQIRQYTAETMMTEDVWSMAQSVAFDGGIGLANGIGEALVTGSGSSQPLGISTWIKSAGAATRRHMGPAANAFLTGAQGFKHSQMASFIGSLSKEYFKVPSKKILMRLSVWSNLIGVPIASDDNRPIFVNGPPNQDINIANMSLPQYAVDIILDENLDVGTAASEVPMIYGDFNGYCARLAGGPRIDFSTEFGFRQDRLAYRFLQHAGGTVVDEMAFRGLALQ